MKAYRQLHGASLKEARRFLDTQLPKAGQDKRDGK
jgi:ribosomal protein L7/L12